MVSGSEAMMSFKLACNCVVDFVSIVINGLINNHPGAQAANKKGEAGKEELASGGANSLRAFTGLLHLGYYSLALHTGSRHKQLQVDLTSGKLAQSETSGIINT